MKKAVDIKAYIESGVLEAYALGFASEAEIRQLEEMMLQYPEIKKELEEIQNALNSVAIAEAKMPPPETEQLIKNKLFDQPVRAISNRKESSFPWTAIAATIAVVAIATNVWLYSAYTKTKQELSALEAEKMEYAGALKQLMVKNSLTEQQLSFFAQPDLRHIEMKPVAGKTPQSANVYWNSKSGELLVNVKDLPPAPAGKQYQLWAIVEGKPVDLGLYDADSPFQWMKQVTSAQAFAVTLENAGGSPVPTMDQMVVMGGV